MTKEHITGHEETKPDNEESSKSHPLFKAKVNGIDSTIFLDYGSNSSWVCESRTVPSNTFTSSKPLVIKGLGQKPAATIIRDSVVNITLPNDSDLGSWCGFRMREITNVRRQHDRGRDHLVPLHNKRSQCLNH